MFDYSNWGVNATGVRFNATWVPHASTGSSGGGAASSSEGPGAAGRHGSLVVALGQLRASYFVSPETLPGIQLVTGQAPVIIGNITAQVCRTCNASKAPRSLVGGVPLCNHPGGAFSRVGKAATCMREPTWEPQ